MAGTAKKKNPGLWDKVKNQVTKGDKGGKPGQWSARKAQMASSEYKKQGGTYEGKKSDDNHLQQWTKEEWGTKSGKESGKTGERYLPKKARESLSKDEYDRTTAKKRADSRKGKQFSGQPRDVARKTAPHRDTGSGGSRARASGNGRGGPTRADLMKKAAEQGIRGRSRMTKDQLQHALH